MNPFCTVLGEECLLLSCATNVMYEVLSLHTSTHTHIVEDQVAEVYKDFEVAAQVDPERMKRRSQASSDSSSIASRDLK